MILFRFVARLLAWLFAPTVDPPWPRPTGLIAYDWGAARRTFYRDLSERDSEPALFAFMAGYAAAFDRLSEATVHGTNLVVWHAIAVELAAYSDALCRPRSRPSAGDLGRRPETPPPVGRFVDPVELLTAKRRTS